MPRFDMLNTQYLDRLREAGVQPEEVDFVMCTHLHVDHVGWNTRLENGKWVPTFPNARYVMSRTDHDHWAAEAERARHRGLSGQHLQQFRAADRRGEEGRVRVGRARHVRLPHAEARARPHAGTDTPRSRLARQARDLPGRRAAQSRAGAAVEMEQLVLRGPRSRARDAATRCWPTASSRARC